MENSGKHKYALVNLNSASFKAFQMNSTLDIVIVTYIEAGSFKNHSDKVLWYMAPECLLFFYF